MYILARKYLNNTSMASNIRDSIFHHQSVPIPQTPCVVTGNCSSSEIMKAAMYNCHGNTEVISIASNCIKPTPSIGQVLVKVIATSVNPVDIKLRANKISKFALPLPKIPGCDFAGVVVNNEKSCTGQFAIGDKVFGMMPIIQSSWGAGAEYLAIDELGSIAHAPVTITDAESCSLPLVGLTVLQGFQSYVHDRIPHYKSTISPQPDARDNNGTVLIQAGAGGLGSFAIQYCKNELNMYVIATCKSDHVEFVRSLGADRVVDYTVENFEDVVQDVDVVFDPMAFLYEQRTLALGCKVLKQNGYYIHVASSWHTLHPKDCDPLGLAIPEVRLERVWYRYCKAACHNILRTMGVPVRHYDYVLVHSSPARLQQVVQLVDEGKVRPVLDSVFPFEQFRDAHNRVETGHCHGKVVVKIQS